jgi:putative selenate reductase
VDVCPNRANVWIAVDEEYGFRNAWQILHLDALCNECGNCGTFCPYDGLPYKDKLTLFSSKADFDASRNDGFYVSGAAGQPKVHLRLHGVLREPSGAGPEDREAEQVLAIARTVLKDHGYLLDTSS